MARVPIGYLDIPPQTIASGTVRLPGSKSISNRVLLLTALTKGPTQIDGLLDSDDTQVMLEALKQLGISIEKKATEQVIVNGQAMFPVKQAKLYMGNAGTAIRSLTAVLSISSGQYELSGVARMHERPIGDLVDALRQFGAQIAYLGKTGYPPLRIQPEQLPIDLDPTIEVDGSVSSQFLTALLIASPLLTAKLGRNVRVKVKGELISKPYIEITLNLMRRFGVPVQQNEWREFVIDAKASYQSPRQIQVEGDASSASYFMALGLLGKGPIKIIGIDKNSIQGDIYFADFLSDVGAQIIYGKNFIEVSAPTTPDFRIKAFDLDFNLIPDAAMTAAVLALFADGPCTLRNIGSWRVKETDRIAAMQTELSKLGAQVSNGQDWLRVAPPSTWQSATINTYDDHRMAMCFSLAAFGPLPIRIMDPDCVSKTYPEYFSQFKKMLVQQ